MPKVFRKLFTKTLDVFCVRHSRVCSLYVSAAVCGAVWCAGVNRWVARSVAAEVPQPDKASAAAAPSPATWARPSSAASKRVNRCMDCTSCLPGAKIQETEASPQSNKRHSRRALEAQARSGSRTTRRRCCVLANSHLATTELLASEERRGNGTRKGKRCLLGHLVARRAKKRIGCSAKGERGAEESRTSFA